MELFESSRSSRQDKKQEWILEEKMANEIVNEFSVPEHVNVAYHDVIHEPATIRDNFIVKIVTKGKNSNSFCSKKYKKINHNSNSFFHKKYSK